MNELVKTIIEGIQEKKGERIIVTDLRETDGAECDYFVICQAGSPTHVTTVAQSVGEYVRDHAGARPMYVTGLKNSEWVAMDYSEVMVHVFLPETRAFYDLEHLWADAAVTEIPDLY